MTDDYNPSTPHEPVKSRRWPRWIVPVLIGVLGFILVHPFDGPLSQAAIRLAGRLHGDLHRELFAWQQYGQGVCIALVALLIWLLDAPRRRRLLDLLLAVLLAEVTSQSLKMLVGRPRPRPEFQDPHTFLGPWGMYPITHHGTLTLVHAWDTAAGASADLWSMPSSHTLFAAMLSTFLAILYPKLRWLMVALACMVGFSRVLFDAHWPTDVIVGGALGMLIGQAVTHGLWGVRVLDWLWIRFVNTRAEPAFPAAQAYEQRGPMNPTSDR